VSDGSRFVVLDVLGLKEALGGDHQGVLIRVFVVRGPLEKDVSVLLEGNISLPKASILSLKYWHLMVHTPVQ
jgi:hypothetical protein